MGERETNSPQAKSPKPMLSAPSGPQPSRVQSAVQSCCFIFLCHLKRNESVFFLLPPGAGRQCVGTVSLVACRLRSGQIRRLISSLCLSLASDCQSSHMWKFARVSHWHTGKNNADGFCGFNGKAGIVAIQTKSFISPVSQTIFSSLK